MKFWRKLRPNWKIAHFALVVLCLTPTVQADIKRWSGAAANDDWVSGSNWNPANVPTSSDDIIFDNTLVAIPISMVVNGGDVEAQTVTFQTNFNSTSTTLIGGATSHSSFLTLGGPGTGPNPLIKVSSTNGTITFARQNGGPSDLNVVLAATSSIYVNSGAILIINADVSGTGGFSKTGLGALRLGGTNTYTGATTVSAGILALTTSGLSVCSISNSPTIMVNAGGVFDVSGVPFLLQSSQTLGGSGSVQGNVGTTAGATITPGASAVAGTLTFNNNLSVDGATLVFDLANVSTEGGGINDEIIVAGNLTLSGNNVIFLNYLTGSLPAGTYKIIKYSGTKTGSFTLGASYQNVTLDDTSTPNYVTIVVSSPGSSTLNLTWQGDGVNNVWDMAATANWLNGASSAVYYDPANVTFNDSGSATPAVNLVQTVIPHSVTVNSANNYTIGGAGKIGSVPGLNNPLTKNGNGVLTLSTTNDFAGGVSIQAGKLKVGNALAIPNGPGKGDVIVNGTLDLNGHSITINGFSGGGTVDNGAGTLTNTLSFGANGGTGTFSGVIKNTIGAVALSKVGAGTIALSGNNTFSGAVTIDDGALRISQANGLGDATGDTTVSGGTTLARLELLGGITVNEPLSLAMKFGVGVGTVDPQIPHVENISGVNTLAGPFSLNGGGTYWTFQSDAGKLIISQGLSSSASGGRPILLQGDGDGEIQGSIQNGSGLVALVKGGVGTWTISGNNSYSQPTTINAGILRIGNGNAIPNGSGKGDVTVNGTLDLNGHSITINGLLGGGTVDNQSGLLNYTLTVGANNRSGTFSGVIKNTSGTVGISKIGTGTFTLSGNNTYAGNTTVNAGTLFVNGSIGSGAVTVNASATLACNGTIDGPVTIQAGGTLSPGTSIGTLTINNSLNLSGTTLMEINKTGSTLSGDLVQGISTLTYGGTLSVTATGDPLAQNDTFHLFNAAAFAGSFATLNLPPLPPCLVWDTSRLTVDGTIKVVNEAVAPVLGTITATEVQSGTVDVKNCANSALQGTINISVAASDNCALAAPPVIALTNGANTATASFVNESPAGTFNYTWTVASGTAGGTWTATATAADASGNTSRSTFTVCVLQQSQVTGQVELQSFAGTNRAVTFVVTSSSNTPLLTNTQTLTFSGTPVKLASYTLNVPLNAANLSAKTAWSLRRRLALTFSSGQATANFSGATKLLTGDITQDNKVNTSDNNTFKVYNGKLVSTTPAAAQADLTGDGRVNTSDYNVLKGNLGKTGDPQ